MHAQRSIEIRFTQYSVHFPWRWHTLQTSKHIKHSCVLEIYLIFFLILQRCCDLLRLWQLEGDPSAVCHTSTQQPCKPTERPRFAFYLATQLQVHYLCNVGRSSVSCSGSLVLGITPMMVLFSEVPFSSRSRTRCMFRGESTLNLTVEPGRRTPSWVSSNGRRLGIWIAPPETIIQFFFLNVGAQWLFYNTT